MDYNNKNRVEEKVFSVTMTEEELKLFSEFLEQKEYTRVEKRAIKEIYKATRGLSRLPKGASARDVHRFNQFATDLRQLSLGNVSSFDRENAKQLLNNSGLPISAGQVDKLVDKYTNKRALYRLSRMKNRKGDVIDTTAIHKPFITSSKIMDKGAKIKNAADESFDRIHESFRPDNNMIKSLTDYAQKNGIKVERLQNHPEFRSKYDSFVETMPDMSRAIDGGYLGKIVQNTSALEGDLAHEIGHVKTFKSRAGREIKRFRGTSEYPQLIRRNSRGKAFLDDKNYVLQRVADNVIGVANENSASAYGNALLKKLGSPRLGILERNQSDALSSYMGLSANHIGHDIRESLRWT